MMRKFLSSLLRPKKALDSLLDTMADGLDGHDNYDELGGHGDLEREGRNRMARRHAPETSSDPEDKGTELAKMHDVVIIPLPICTPRPDPADAEFFKESEPVDPLAEMQEHEFFKEAPEFEMTSKGISRVGSPTKDHSPEWEVIQNILTLKDYKWLGRVSDGTEMWGNGKERIVYDPATKTWEHQVGGKTAISGAIEELDSKLSNPPAPAPEPVQPEVKTEAPKTSALKWCVACECGECIEHQAKIASKIFYHVTQTAKIPKIKEKGIIPLQSSNWVQGDKGGERYGEGEIYACDNLRDAVRWGAKMDWDFNHEMGSGKISIIAFDAGDAKWEVDENDPIQQMQNKGHWMKLVGHVKPAQITKVSPINLNMTRAVVQGQEPEFDKEAGPLVSYGMGQPLGGTDNDTGGEDDEDADTDQNTGLGGMNLTSSDDEYDSYDYEAEDEKLAAAMDAEDDECESRAQLLGECRGQ